MALYPYPGDFERRGLEVAYQLTGADPRRLVVSGQRSYTVLAVDSVGSAGERAAAYGVLARELSEDAVDWLLFHPRPLEGSP